MQHHASNIWVTMEGLKTIFKTSSATPPHDQQVEDCLLSGAKFLDPRGSSFALCSYDSHQIQVNLRPAADWVLGNLSFLDIGCSVLHIFQVFAM